MFENHFSENACNMQASEIREFFELTERPEVISFGGGFPNENCLPCEEVQKLTEELLATEQEAMLQYTPTEGQQKLREYIVKFMANKGVEIDVDNVLITSGSQQGLDLVNKIFVDPDDLILTESPSYVGGLGAINNYQGEVLGIKVDENGLRTDLLEKKLKNLAAENSLPKFIYLVADFNNPTGLTISTERRRKLVELAEQYEFLILEDDPYSELIYEGEAKPLIKSFDKQGYVVYLGSFSKIFVPGLRIGWVVAHKEIIDKLILAKQSTDLCTNAIGQRLITVCGERGIIDKHIIKLRKLYRQKRDRILAALEKYCPEEVSWTEPKGGFYCWVKLPKTMNSRDLLVKAIEKDVAFVNGAAFSPNGGGQNAFRISFSQPCLAEIDEGISRLGGVITEEMAKLNSKSQRCIV
ncbi:aminotransferase-like domain-containing protein [Fuchsiella alkaliacetigena]|uniref:aminotransferase-like domain-containing protein n=1 Tax=Fuchsiella alkaliacetigena TaxID=957042 RepID=UPI002009E81B|nr:PLP-dependent aminotransferase family protein [Fuchsiella alkaliacetigena]MCK8824385.1 PLP-dependent aminotransferase family protein [Fuchsiella alkaliacetigena]